MPLLMPIPQAPLFIFDFDGTIADTYHQVVAISNLLAAEFNYLRIHEDKRESLKDKNVRQIIKELQVPMMKIPSIIARAKQELHKNVGDINPISGLKEILDELHRQAIPMGILSSNSAENVDAFLKNHDMERLFEFAKTTSRVWSKHATLRKILTERGTPVDQFIYVGDELRDVTAAQKMSGKIIAVAWGFNSYQALETHRPDYLIRRPEELLKIARALSKASWTDRKNSAGGT
jgi:phosphoglycolate phosphatase